MMGSGTLDGKPEYRGVAGEGAIVNWVDFYGKNGFAWK